MKRKQLGFTLIELLLSVTLYTGILATMFSVLAAMRKAESVRDNAATTTKAASYAFEPMIRSIKNANAVEQLYNSTYSDCVSVRGFYLMDANTNGAILDQRTPVNLETDRNLKLVTIAKENDFNPATAANPGPAFRWVKREYSVENNAADEKGDFYPTIYETTYDANPVDSNPAWPNGFRWPIPLGGCDVANQRPDATTHWTARAGGKRALTSNRVKIRNFIVHLRAPEFVYDASGGLNALSDPNTTVASPYASLQIIVQNVKAGSPSSVTLATTVTPDFVYGDQRD